MNSIDDVVRALPVFLRNDAQEVIDQHVERASIAWAQIDQTRDMNAALRLRDLEQTLEDL